MKILEIDVNHPLIHDQLVTKGFQVDTNYSGDYQEILYQVKDYQGLILRSRIPIDRNFLDQAQHLKFIARVGAGMENIDVDAAKEFGIPLINSPEGNRDAVAEHVLGMLLVLTNRLFISSEEVKNGIWRREENRGTELMGKTFGIIGYGHMGKALAKRLIGFGLEVIFYDILPNIGDQFATQVSLEELQERADFVSLHVPLTQDTYYYIDEAFIDAMQKPFYLINTARGKNVKTSALVEGLKNQKVKGAALDVLEYEKSSFENLENKSSDLSFLLNDERAIITPHIAGWTHESKIKLAQVIVDKIFELYPGSSD